MDLGSPAKGRLQQEELPQPEPAAPPASTSARPPSPLLQPVSGQALSVTLSGEAKNEGGGQDIPGASSAMGGVSMETSGGP